MSLNRNFSALTGAYSFHLKIVNSLGTIIYPMSLKSGLFAHPSYSYSHFYNDDTVITFWDQYAKVPTPGYLVYDYDVWITKNNISALLSTSNSISSEKEIQIYPNPTSDTVYFSKIAQQVALFDASGRLIMKAENSKELNISFLQNGIYYLKFVIDGKLKTFKVIKK